MIITLSGTNTFLVQNELNSRIDAFLQEHDGLALERYDAGEAGYDRLQEALQSLPFLASRKLVIIKDPGADKQFAERFENLIKTVPETSDIVLVEPRPDKRTVFYKALKKHTEFHEYNELREQELPRWLADGAKARGGSISAADASYLVRRAGAGQLMLSNELDKLLAYNPAISREAIDLLVEPTPQSTVFELLDAAFAGNHRQALALYKEQRALKKEPQEIIGLLAWQLHVLAVIKTAGDRSIDDIAREARINPYVLRKSAAVARKLSLTDIKRLVRDALALDTSLKTESIDADDALQHYLLTISQ
jgi:DNA polymerase III delta subunit